VLEYRMNDAHRRTIWVRDSVTVSTEGDQVKLRGILINISELKEMEASLRLAHSQLEVRVEHRTAALARTCIELQHEMSERKRLEQELLDLTDKGRRQQGMDVHGDVGQNLAGIAFMLKCLGVKLEQSSPSEASQAERIRSLLDQTMARTRDPAQDLVSFNRQKESLPEALESLAAQAETVFDVSCRLKRNGATAPIEPDVVAQFYNIAQEAIVNAVKFAKAGRVVIALTRKNQRLVLTVQHDGHPFPTPLHHSLELGLKIMNYRAKLIGAALRMTESGKQGRMVTCVFPAKPDVN
jgi:signal transduction histidine kinase